MSPPGPRLFPGCWLAHNGFMEHGDPMPACNGRIVACHLIPKKMLTDRQSRDPRVVVPGCGGPMGNGGHHGMLDVARTLRIPRANLPKELWEFAWECGLAWWLDREYMESWT